MANNIFKSEFHISKMDCHAEEALIRMKLSDLERIKSLQFDIPSRKLEVLHEGEIAPVAQLISELNLGGSLVKTTPADGYMAETQVNESKSLWVVLLINFSFFIIEATFGWLSQSMGLVADGLDMLADAMVYGLSLIAVGGTIRLKKRIATIAGYLQFSLAILGFMEVIRRFVFSEAIPDHRTMIVVSVLALSANALCLFLLTKTKSEEAHMRASMIFTSNDIIINSGVILAGILVLILETNWPDLIVGSIVFILVLMGARSILQLGK